MKEKTQERRWSRATLAFRVVKHSPLAFAFLWMAMGRLTGVSDSTWYLVALGAVGIYVGFWAFSIWVAHIVGNWFLRDNPKVR